MMLLLYYEVLISIISLFNLQHNTKHLYYVQQISATQHVNILKNHKMVDTTSADIGFN